MSLRCLLVTVSLTALVMGCAVGPDFERPAAPDISSYESAPSSGQVQVIAADIPAEWWEVFHSKPLNQLIVRALNANPDIAAAEASLRAAQENTAAGEGVLVPSITGSFSTTREKTTGAAAGGRFSGSLYTLHNATVGVTYGLDLFGGSRREIEGLEAREGYQQFQLEAVRLSLAGNVVTAAVQEASLRGQIEATHEVIAAQEKQLDLLKKQLTLGGVARSSVLTQEATLLRTKATLPPLEKQLAQTRHLLSVLGGEFPSHETQSIFDFAHLTLPTTLPVSLPSKLVEQRPDIRAAEENLHEASAEIGVAVANRLPKITLSADTGSQANSLSKLFTSGSGLWSAGFGVAQTVFDAGTLAHEQSAAEANYDVAAAQYRKTVLAAFQDVADTLRALQADADAYKAELVAERAASDNAQLTRNQFNAGAVSYFVLLAAEQDVQQAKIARIQSEARRYADVAALFQSLGGGWWNRKAEPSTKKTGTTLTGILVP